MKKGVCPIYHIEVKMKLDKHVMLLAYEVDLKNSVPYEPMTRDYPGNPASYALKIFKIAYEDKNSVLRKLKVGEEIFFKIEQEVAIPNDKKTQRKTGEEETMQLVAGEASGTILEILDFPDKNQDDEEYTEVTMILKDGFGENL